MEKYGEYTHRAHRCVDNDNSIRVCSLDGKIDEIHISDSRGKEWIVVGYEDLKNAIKKAKYYISKHRPK